MPRIDDDVDLEDLYDETTLGLLDARPAPAPPLARPHVTGWRGGLGAGVIVAAAMVGVQEVLEPERRDPIIEEIDLDGLAGDRAPVEYHHVPGAPAASWAIVRPWLL